MTRHERHHRLQRHPPPHSSRHQPVLVPGRPTRRIVNPLVSGLVKLGRPAQGRRRAQRARPHDGRVALGAGQPAHASTASSSWWRRAARRNGCSNLRVAGRRRASGAAGASQEFTAVELDDAAKPTVLRAYLEEWAWEVGAFFDGVGADSTDEQLARDRRQAPDLPHHRRLTGRYRCRPCCRCGSGPSHRRRRSCWRRWRASPTPRSGRCAATYAPDLVYVNEMVMATAVVYRNDKTLRMMTFGPDERPRSLQIYGSDPDMLGRAVHTVCDEGLRRPRRPQLRLPGGEGDATWRRGGGAGQAAAAAGGRACRGARRPSRTACPSPPSSGWACGTTCAPTSRPV